MSTPTAIVVLALSGPEKQAREDLIKAIFARGHIARFTNKITGCVKRVKEWNIDEGGDLIAFESGGRVPYVCWDGPQYGISEDTE